jgi:hypothetical protein
LIKGRLGKGGCLQAGFRIRVRKIINIGNQGMRTLIDDGRERDFPKLETFLSSWSLIDFL